MLHEVYGRVLDSPRTPFIKMFLLQAGYVIMYLRVFV